MSEDFTDAPLVSAEPDMIEIKLFGRWSTSDVQVSDISLTVMFSKILILSKKLI